MVGSCPEAAVFRSSRPQRHHVGHRGPQRKNITAAGTPVSPSVLLISRDGSSFVCLRDV